jgi:hypothetical protein
MNKNIILLLLFFSNIFQLEAKASVIATDTTFIQYGLYSLEIYTTYLKEESIPPFFYYPDYPATIKQLFIFKKNGKILTIASSPANVKKYETLYRGSVDLLEVGFNMAYIVKVNEQKYYRLVAYLCNGDCPEIDLIYSLDGELVYMNYIYTVAYTEPFKQYRTKEFLSDFKKSDEISYFIKPSR